MAMESVMMSVLSSLLGVSFDVLLGEEGPFSLNPDEPFTLTSPDDHVETIGRVLGIVDTDHDFPTTEEGDLLRELCHEDLEEFPIKRLFDTITFCTRKGQFCTLLGAPLIDSAPKA